MTDKENQQQYVFTFRTYYIPCIFLCLCQSFLLCFVPALAEASKVAAKQHKQCTYQIFLDGKLSAELQQDGISDNIIPEHPYPDKSQTDVSDLKKAITQMGDSMLQLKEQTDEIRKDNLILKQQINEQANRLTDSQQNTSIEVQLNLEQLYGNLTYLTASMRLAAYQIRAENNRRQAMEKKLGDVMVDVVELKNQMARVMETMPENAGDKRIPVDQRGTCSPPNKYRDCVAVYQSGRRKSGVYYITPDGAPCSIAVWCDHDTPPGGWLVIQRREHGDVSFNRPWLQYRRGFGDVTGDHWLGLDSMFLLTNQDTYSLRADLWDFFDSRVFAEYTDFHIGGARERFKLHVDGHLGTAPDGFSKQNGSMFSTPDWDNDMWDDYHCGKQWRSGWWFKNCWFVLLNGPYHNEPNVKARGISWNDWKVEQLRHVEMKIRPKYFYV